MKPLLKSPLSYALKISLKYLFQKFTVTGPTFPHTQPSPQNSPEERAPFLPPFTHQERRKMFSLFAPQCCFQNTGPLSPIREVASTEGPHHPLTTFINTQDPLPPETSAVCSVFLSSTFLGDDRGDYCPCSPDILMLKTLRRADYYEHLSASSAT